MCKRLSYNCLECVDLQTCLSMDGFKQLKKLKEYKLGVLRNNLNLLPMPELKNISREIFRLDFSIKNFQEMLRV